MDPDDDDDDAPLLAAEVLVAPAEPEVDEDEAAAAPWLPPTRHSLTVQSTPLVRNRSLKSTLPSAGWKSMPVTGPAWPLYASPGTMPALAPARSYRCAGYTVPSSVPAKRVVVASALRGSPSAVMLTSSVLACCGCTSSSVSFGRASMSSAHAHTVPSVDALTSECALGVPTSSSE